MRLILWVTLVGVVTSKNAGNVPSISIAGGTPAAAGEFPYMASLTHLGQFLCGGVLIGPFHVLTAGSCLYNGPTSASEYTVHVNTLAYNGSTAGAVTRKVKKFIIHPNFISYTAENDLTLLVLNQSVTNVRTIPLPSSATATTTKKPTRTTKKPATTTKKPVRTTKKPATITKKPATITKKPATTTKKPATTTKKPATTTKSKVAQQVKTSEEPAVRALSGYANMNAVIAGWGSTSSDGSVSKKLLKANVTIQDDSVCTERFFDAFFVNAMLCAYAPPKHACYGDQGGPIIVKGVLVGTISWDIGCGDPSYVGIYTRITTYVNWIKKTMTNNPG